MKKINFKKRKNNIIKYTCIIAFIFIFAFAGINIFADNTESFYASDLVNDINGGAVNATFKFGRYPRTNVPGISALNGELELVTPDPETLIYSYNGDEYYKLQSTNYNLFYKIEPITWRILRLDTDSHGNVYAYAMTEEIVDDVYYDNQQTDFNKWGDTTPPSVRTFLNNETTYPSGMTFRDKSFIDKAFNATEKSYLKPFTSPVYNSPNDISSKYYDGDEVEEKVSLLSVGEIFKRDDYSEDELSLAEKYGFDKDVKAKANSNRAATTVGYSSVFAYNAWSVWFTKSRTNAYNANYIGNDGTISQDPVNAIEVGIRPVIYVKLNDINPDITLEAKNKTNWTFDGWYKDGVKELSETSNVLSTTIKYNDLDSYKGYFSLENGSKEINGKKYTPWFYKSKDDNTNYGYLNYGMYPKTKLLDQNIINILEDVDNFDTNGVTLEVPYNIYDYGYNRYIKVLPTGESKYDYYLLEPITWQILSLDSSSNEVFVLSKDVIDATTFGTQSSYLKWSDGVEIRTFLNGINEETGYRASGFFGKAFSDDEKLNVKEKTYIAYDEQGPWNVNKYDGDSDTQDKVTLLSRNELSMVNGYSHNFYPNKFGFAYSSDYMNESSGRVAYGTDYALFGGTVLDNVSDKGTMGYWTKSREQQSSAYMVDAYGVLDKTIAVDKTLGVRPALTLDLTSVVMTNGTGSINNPYTPYGVRIDVVANSGGSVTPCNGEFTPGTLIEVTVAPNENYTFDGWYENNTKISSDSTLSFNVTTKRNIIAKFKYKKELTKWYELGQDSKTHGYVNYGLFPQTKITNTTLISSLTSLRDDDISDENGIIISGNDKYVYDKDSDSFYLLEPITWRIIDIENSGDGKTNLFLLSDKIIESKTYASNNAINFNNSLLKNYLNNTVISSDTDYVYKNSGFFAKAFSEDEKANILNEYRKSYFKINEGPTIALKVRILGLREYTNINNLADKYGFTKTFKNSNGDKSRIGIATDYALSDYEGPASISYPEGQAIEYFTIDKVGAEFNGGTNQITVKADGSLWKYSNNEKAISTNLTSNTILANTDIHDKKYGVRPSITIQLNDDNTLLSGTGEKSNPYVLGKTPLDPPGTGGGGGSSRKKKEEPKPTEPIKPEEPIIPKKHKTYIKGYKDQTFKPNEKITRAEVATVLARINDLFSETNNYKTYKNKYIDLLMDAWYDNYVGFTTKENIFEGYDDNSFKPEINMTRAEFIASIVRMFDLKEDKNIKVNFKDIDDMWCENYIKIMASNKYIDNTNYFRPNEHITRAEACKIINQAIDNYLITNENITKAQKEKFKQIIKDVNEYDWYYYDVINAVLEDNN